MLKLFLSVALVLIGAYLLRRRWRVARGLEPATPSPIMRQFATVLLIVMVTLTGLHFSLQWWSERELITVQVVNANTGQITLYQARRGGVDGRVLRTVDGREIRLADVERMIILPAETISETGN